VRSGKSDKVTIEREATRPAEVIVADQRAFRETKQTLDVRPLYHHRHDTTVGHIVGCFLALRLEVDLQRRLDAAGVNCSWPDLMRDLDQVKAVEVTLDGRRYRLRTELRGAASTAFAAAGVRPPSMVEHLGGEPPAANDEMARA
jgi:hypothetical protein